MSFSGKFDAVNSKTPKNNKFVGLNKTNELDKTFQKKKLKPFNSLNDVKALELKKRMNLSSFHLVGEEDKYKAIEKNIQNKILNISLLILNESNYESENGETNKPHKLQSKRNKNLIETAQKLYPNINTSLNMGNNKAPRLSRVRPAKRSRLSRLTQNAANLVVFQKLINERNRKLRKAKLVYDSFGEDESDKDVEQSNYGVSPRNVFVDIYDILILISAFFCLFYLPYRLARTKMIINDNEYLILFMIFCSEILFVIDLIFGFFRWYYNNEFKLVSNKYMIINHYLYGDFFFDLIMAIPFYSILKYINSEKIDINNIYNENNYLYKVAICLKAFKIFKLNHNKNNRLIYFFSRRFAKYYYLERIYQITNFTIMVLSIFNLFIGFHIYMAQLSYPNWIIKSGLGDQSFLDIYISSLYFIVATLSSVGYGDIVCVNKEETCFQIILLSIGLVAYSWIISTVGDYVKNKSRANINFNKDMTKLEEIRIAYPNMPFKLYNKIQQHIQRMFTQSKKYEYNLLVNSLPYYLQNSVLFQIHKNEINNFTFFKGCDNSNFILKVLTHFIPIFSKKNIVLVGEGEFFENIFFIKNGRLSLEAIIDLDKIEMSIEKYLQYRFEEIEKIEYYSEMENSIQQSRINDKSFKRNIGAKSNKFFEKINKQFENIEDNSNMNESNIEQEIGRCDFQTENQDLYKGNIHNIHILDLLKNEYFGETLMFLNIPNPLSLRVKSKRVELYILKKKDAFNIKRDYQNIWQRINKKSIHNIKSLKSLTLDIINRYCKLKGYIIKGTTVIKRKTKKYNMDKYQTFAKNEGESKLGSGNNKNKNAGSSLGVGSFKKNIKKIKAEKDKVKEKKTMIPTTKLNININNKDEKNENEKENKKGTKELNKSFDSKRIRRNTISESSVSSSLSFTFSENVEKTKSNKNISDKHKLSLKQNNNFTNLNNNFLKLKNQRQSKNLSPVNIDMKKKVSYIAAYPSLSGKNMQSKSPTSLSNNFKYSNKNNNNFLGTGVSTINEFNISNRNNLIIEEKAISFQISSSYKNINYVSKGQYINDNKFQELIQKIVKYYIKTNSEKSKDSSKKGDNFSFNYYKYIKDKIRKSKVSSENFEISDKNITLKRHSATSEKNKNQLSIYTDYRYSKFRNKENIPSNDIKNILFKNDNCSKYEIPSPLYKDKIILEHEINKSLSSMNQLNSINISKNQEIYSKSSNISKGQLDDNNNIVYKNVQDIQRIKDEIENKKAKKEKSYSNQIINNKNGNSFHEVNLNYVNNFCIIS